MSKSENNAQPEQIELLELATHVANFMHVYREARRRNRFKSWEACDRKAEKLEKEIGKILSEEKRLF